MLSYCNSQNVIIIMKVTLVEYYPQAGVLKTKIASIKWSEIICGFILINDKGKMVGHLDKIKKVIGNIYQNKNLLKGGK